MKRVTPVVVGLVAVAVAVAGCSAPDPDPLDARYFGTPAPAPAAPAAPASDPANATEAGSESTAPIARDATESRPDATASASPTPTTTPSTDPTDSPKAGKATGPITDKPFEVDGIPVVSKDHRLSAKYVPTWAKQPNGLHPDAAAAFKRLQAAAKKDGLALSIRSGYRSHATQKDSFAKAMKEYPEKTARLYFAEAGASEHQLGLAIDAWDGKNRGTAFSRTPHAKWLAEHAHEHGFIVRYPQDKTHITGYAWEPWHLRWVGPEVSREFGPNATLTLEEYLGLA